MATKFTQIVGQPFSKPVRAEFERRRSLDQNYDTISELYQPYFKIKRLKSLRPVTAMEEPNENDYMSGRFSSLGKVYEEGEYDIGYGMDSLEEDSELKGYPAITSVTFELEDFTFYRATINFEIPDVTYFQEFREKWLQFGAPIEMEWGRYSPVEFEEDSNEDMLPNVEKRMGNVVKFDYGMDGGGKEITGTLTVYSVTWLPVLQEGTSEEYETERFQTTLKEYYRRSITGIFFETLNKEEFKDLFWASESINRSILEKRQEDLPWYVPVELAPLYLDESEKGGESYISIEEAVYNLVSETDTNSVDKRINSFFRLDEKRFGSSTYYFISLRCIEHYLNKILNKNRSKRERGTFEGDLFEYDLTNCSINSYNIQGISSRMPDKILVNPRNNYYKLNDDGEYIKDTDGNITLSGDIFISAFNFFDLIEKSKNGYSLVSEIVSLIKDATAGIVDIEQKRENGVVIDGSIVINGIGLVDSSSIRDEGGKYTTLKLHDPSEKIQNVSLNTEISDDISNLIFFKSRGEFDSNGVDINEVYLFSKEYNMKHFHELIMNRYGDRINKSIKNRNRDDNLESMTRGGAGLELLKYEETFDIDIDNSGDIVLKNDIGETVIDEIYDIRKDFLNKMERDFQSISANISQSTIEKTDSRELPNKVSKDHLTNILSFLYMYFSQTIELQKSNYFTKNNFRMPYTISFEIDGIAGIIPSQAFKVDLENFPVEYNDQQSALFVVTGLSHTFEGNSWVTAINGSFWIDFKQSTFLNKHEKEGMGDMITTEYENTISALKLIFKRKILKDLDLEDESINLLKDFHNIDFDRLKKSIIESLKI